MNVAPQPSSKRLIQRASVIAKAAGSVMGLPGISDVARMLRDLPEDSQPDLDGLNAHVEGLLQIVDLNHLPPRNELTELLSDLKDLHLQLGALLNDRQSLNTKSAQKRLEDLKRLSKQVDNLSNRILVLHLQTQERSIEALRYEIADWLQSISRTITEIKQAIVPPPHAASTELDYVQEDKLPIVDLDRFILHGASHDFVAKCIPHKDSLRPYCPPSTIKPPSTPLDSPVRVTCTPGTLGSVRVIRKSYNSSNPAAAAKLAIADLLLLSMHSHPNFTRLQGVVKDLAGRVRGIVVTAAQTPFREFLANVTEPAAFVNCYRDIHNLIQAGFFDKYFLQLYVDPRGHVAAMPSRGAGADSESWLLGLELIYPASTRMNMDPKFKLIWDICAEVRYWTSDRMQDFPDNVSCLEQDSTPLDVLRAALDTKLAPPSSSFTSYTRWGSLPLPWIRRLGVIGTMKDGIFVELPGQKPYRETSRLTVKVKYEGGSVEYKVDRESSGWYSLALQPGFQSLTWYDDTVNLGWENFRSRAIKLSQLHGVPADELYEFHHLEYTLSMPGNAEKYYIAPSELDCYEDQDEDAEDWDYDEPMLEDWEQDMLELYPENFRSRDEEDARDEDVTVIWEHEEAPYPLYFHRHPDHAFIRGYQGFISTLPDPRGLCLKPTIITTNDILGPIIVGDGLERDSKYSGYEMSKDYGCRYDTVVAKGLDSLKFKTPDS